MLKNGFVQFSDNDAFYSSTRFDGYLAFLPEPVLDGDSTAHEAPRETHATYRWFSGKDFRWFEFKDTQLAKDLSIQVTASENYLWLFINMRTGISLTLDSIRLVPTDMLLCYQTLIDNHSISVTSNRTWFILLGIDGHILQELMAEYAQLKPLVTTTAERNSAHRIIGTMNLHAKLKRVLNALQLIKFRPFSTYYQLANWNIRFFRRVFQEMEPAAVERTDQEIELYYKAIAYIRENFYDEQINIETIAKALYVSESTLKRAFQDKPFTINEQINEFRLREARELIKNSDKPIATIAFSLNFACPKNFKRLFIKRFMISPLQYRNSMNLKRIF